MAERVPDTDAAAAQQARSVQALLQVARSRFAQAQAHLTTWRQEAMEDYDFAGGKQWPEAILAQRTADGRPCLTINQLPQFIRQVTNEERQNRPTIQVQPVDAQADIETADVKEGLVRQIQNASNADIAYDTAMESVAHCGLGYIRVNAAYLDPWSFDQEPTIERILNPLSVYLDPASTDPTGADAEYGFIIQTMQKDVYTQQYGALPAEASAWEHEGSSWITPDTVRVAEYYWREWERDLIALLPDGSVRRLADVPRDLPPVQVRETRIPCVYWAKITGYQVLEQTRWPGRTIPIVKVTGEEHLNGQGELNYSGVPRFAKDSQYAYDLWASAEAETIALAPKAPYVMAEGQQEGYEALWATANTRNHSYLLYKPHTHGGVLVPPPQRQVIEPPVQAISQARLLAAQDLSATTGIYAPQLGQQGPPGEAAASIYQQRQQGQLGNLHYLDNLRRSVRRVGQILLEVIPFYYDTARTIRILGAEGDMRQVLINQQTVDPKTGQPVLYDFASGRYDAVVEAGPGFATRRQEAASALMNLTQALPQTMQFAADVLVQNLDMPGGRALAERLQKLLPPELQEGKDGQPSQAQQMQAMQQGMQELTHRLEVLDAYARQTTEELEKTKQENQSLQLRLQDKETENVLQSRETDLKQQEIANTFAVDWRKLDIEEQKVQLQASQNGTVEP